MKNKVLKTQSYKVEIVHYEDGSSTMRRTNKSFSVLELLGLTAMIQSDLNVLLKGAMNPNTKVVRKSTNSPIIHK